MISLARGESGFNLAEVTAAILIFMVAMVGVTVVFSGGSANITRSRLDEAAKAYAREKMESISKLPFYRPYNGNTKQDIDDFYYIATGTNPDQLGIGFNPTYTDADKDYNTIPGYPNLKQMVRVQYQQIVTATEQLSSPPPTMKAGWGPMIIGNDSPVDNTDSSLKLILVRVKVFYRHEGMEISVGLDKMAGDSEVKFYPRVDSVSPNGVEQGTNVTLTITGEGFSTTAPGPTVLLTKVGHTDITCTVTDYSLSTRLVASTGVLPMNMVGAGEDAYWNLKVRNTDGMASTLNKAIYVVQNAPFIFYLDPTSGAVGAWVKIVGQDFGVKRDANDNVKFNNILVTTYGNGSGGHSVWANNIIWVQVPATATTGPVTVHKGSLASNGVSFIVGGGTTPTISSISNVEPGESGAHGKVGDRIRIYGTNFGTRAPTEEVVFSVAKNAGINFWTDTVIECVVPPGAVTGNVYVLKTGPDSNNVWFTVDI